MSDLGYVPKVVYWGGGTPSALTAGQIELIGTALKDNFDLSSVSEYSVESSPETLSAETIAAFQSAGMNRLSVGIQSFDASELRRAGRAHSAEQADSAVRRAEQLGCANRNVDIITGFPRQTEEVLKDTLAKTIALRPEHVTSYSYHAVSETAMFRQIERGHLAALNTDQRALAQDLAYQMLTASGYDEYMPMYYSLGPHHKFGAELYYFDWEGDHFGFGSGANSVLATHKLTNARGNLQQYISSPTTCDILEKPGISAALSEKLQALGRHGTPAELPAVFPPVRLRLQRTAGSTSDEGFPHRARSRWLSPPPHGQRGLHLATRRRLARRRAAAAGAADEDGPGGGPGSPGRDDVTSSVLERLEGLVSPFGVIAGARALQARRGLGDVMDGTSAFFGTPVLHLEDRYSAELKQLREHQWEKAQGFGRTFKDPQDARLKAIAEAAERYSSADFGEPVRWSSYRDLGPAALDPGRIPRCSDLELAVPGCPLYSFDPSARIRWVQGIDLPSGDEIWIPAIMAYYGLRQVKPAEHFWYRISTGFAVHSDPVEALVRGICEVIERDAIAISWLQKLALPLVADQELSEDVREMISCGHSHFSRYWLFDATTDLAVPTVLCLGAATYASRLAHSLGCSTGLTIGSAAKKAMLEACFTRRCELATDVPDNQADFHSIFDGARYMAAPSRWPAFGFMVEDAENRPTLDHDELPSDPRATLAGLLKVLSEKGMSAIAIDRTTRELAAVGLTSVNVVIPELQPMSLHPLAQYRAHPRLYTAPEHMGYPVLPEEELNSWPIPFD